MVTFGESKLIKPIHNKDYYKNENAYLRAVYNKNPQIKREGFSFKMFKNNIKNIKAEEHYKRLDTAIESFGRTRAFMTSEEINLLEIKKTIGKSYLKKLMRQQGETKTEIYLDKNGKPRRRQVIDFSEFTWNSALQRYESKNGKVAISFLYPDDTLNEPWWEAYAI